MSTLTIFFNSDGDITGINEKPIYGLDKINTGSRPHLISALSNKKANFINRHFFEFFLEPWSLRKLRLDLKGSLVINGPGSGYFLSDETFTKSPGFFQWTARAFVDRWRNNNYRTYEYIRMKDAYRQENEDFPEKEKAPTGINSDAVLTLKEIPKDWILREFSITTGDYVSNVAAPFTQVNLVGWGRGGVSCYMLANVLKSDDTLCHIPVNILAIDPVTGPLPPEPDQMTLGGNVKEYVGLYARDERSANLPCIIPDTASSTLVHVYPIAGRHTTLIGNPAADGESKPGAFSEPSDLVFYLAMKCLNRWDPSLSISATDSGGYPNLSVNGNQVLAKIKSDYDNYLNMSNTTYSNQSRELKNDREILLNGQITNFRSAQGPRFTPNLGLAKGHIEDMLYFKDIT